MSKETEAKSLVSESSRFLPAYKFATMDKIFAITDAIVLAANSLNHLETSNTKVRLAFYKLYKFVTNKVFGTRLLQTL